MSKAVMYGFILTAQLMSIVGCQRLPLISQSGAIKEIFVREDFSPAEVRVNTGDEVRWTNKQLTPISIGFPKSVQITLSCRNNFGGFYNGGIETTLGPNESASLCFRSSVVQYYDVRMHSALPEGQINVAGSIGVRESADTDLGQRIIR
jgi:plastocyanin